MKMKTYQQTRDELVALLLQYATAARDDQYGTDQEAIDELIEDLQKDLEKMVNS